LVSTISGAGMMFRFPGCYISLFVLLFTIFLQIRWLNSGLRVFPSIVIVPVFQSFWIVVSVIAGMVFFHEYSLFDNLVNAILFPIGLGITVVGVFFLSQLKISTDAEPSSRMVTPRVQSVQHRLTRPSSIERSESHPTSDGEVRLTAPLLMTAGQTVSGHEETTTKTVVDTIRRFRDALVHSLADEDSVSATRENESDYNALESHSEHPGHVVDFPPKSPRPQLHRPKSAIESDAERIEFDNLLMQPLAIAATLGMMSKNDYEQPNTREHVTSIDSQNDIEAQAFHHSSQPVSPFMNSQTNKVKPKSRFSFSAGRADVFGSKGLQSDRTSLAMDDQQFGVQMQPTSLRFSSENVLNHTNQISDITSCSNFSSASSPYSNPTTAQSPKMNGTQSADTHALSNHELTRNLIENHS